MKTIPTPSPDILYGTLLAALIIVLAVVKVTGLPLGWCLITLLAFGGIIDRIYWLWQRLVTSTRKTRQLNKR